VYFERHRKYVDQTEAEIKTHEDETSLSVIYQFAFDDGRE